MFGYFKRRRRQRLMAQPFPRTWQAIIEKCVPYYHILPPDKQDKLKGLVTVFVDEKRFEGAGGLKITDAIRVTIAAQACILLLGGNSDCYPDLQTIIVYPHRFSVEVDIPQPDGTVLRQKQVRLGESWKRGEVILSWDDVRYGAADINDGQNVAFHEFVHQLDGEDGAVDGAPDLKRSSHYIAWARILQPEFDALKKSLEHGQATLIDGYGATSPPEFFAVVTESFFEQPEQLRRRHPELYTAFADYYKQDPAAWRDRHRHA